jgi:hypothetical protein
MFGVEISAGEAAKDMRPKGLFSFILPPRAPCSAIENFLKEGEKNLVTKRWQMKCKH